MINIKNLVISFIFHPYKLESKTENTIQGTRSYDNPAWGQSAPIFFDISGGLEPIQKIYIMFPSKSWSLVF